MTSYLATLASRARYRKPPVHITEVMLGRRGMVSRFGTSLCNVHVPIFSTANSTDPAQATCKKCRARWIRNIRTESGKVA